MQLSDLLEPPFVWLGFLAVMILAMRLAFAKNRAEYEKAAAANAEAMRRQEQSLKLLQEMTGLLRDISEKMDRRT